RAGAAPRVAARPTWGGAPEPLAEAGEARPRRGGGRPLARPPGAVPRRRCRRRIRSPRGLLLHLRTGLVGEQGVRGRRGLRGRRSVRATRRSASADQTLAPAQRGAVGRWTT